MPPNLHSEIAALSPTVDVAASPMKRSVLAEPALACVILGSCSIILIEVAMFAKLDQFPLFCCLDLFSTQLFQETFLINSNFFNGFKVQEFLESELKMPWPRMEAS